MQKNKFACTKNIVPEKEEIKTQKVMINNFITEKKLILNEKSRDQIHHQETLFSH